MPIEIIDGREVLKSPYSISEMFDFMIKHSSKESLEKMNRLWGLMFEGFEKRKPQPYTDKLWNMMLGRENSKSEKSDNQPTDSSS